MFIQVKIILTILTSFSPDRTSNKAINFVPSFKSSIKSSTRSGGTR